jgi:Ca2+/Na+ antiporter
MSTFYLVIGVAVSVIVITWLILRSGHNYSVHDTEAHATNYADEIKEGHGGMTLFLWLSFLAILIWCIIYLVQHAGEFSVIFNR